jgi:hypothetical protein
MDDTKGESPQERQALELLPIFDRMPRYRRSEEVRALKIATAVPTDAGKIKLTFADTYFPSVDVPDWLTAPIFNEESYLMIEESGEPHIVPARGFDQFFKRNT